MNIWCKFDVRNNYLIKNTMHLINNYTHSRSKLAHYLAIDLMEKKYGYQYFRIK